MLGINDCMKMGSASDAGISNYPSDFEFGKNVRNPSTFEFEFELRHIPSCNIRRSTHLHIRFLPIAVKMNFRTLLLTNIGTTNSVITNTTDRYELIITVGGVGVVGGDFSHTEDSYN